MPWARTAVVVAKATPHYRLPRAFEAGARCSLLEYVLDSVWTVADTIVVVFSHEPSLAITEAIAPFGAKIASVGPGSSEVDLVATGLRLTRDDVSLLASDLFPFVRPSILYALLEAARDYDAAIPRWRNGRIEPLLAAYRGPAFLRALEQLPRLTRLAELIDNLYAVRWLAVNRELRDLDPELNSFFRVESIAALRKATRLARPSKS